MKTTNYQSVDDVKSVEHAASQQTNSRRAFMKKAAYAAPTLVALGALTRPTDAKAGFGKPPSGPTW